MTQNIPLLITYVLSLVVMIGLPVLLAFLVTRYFRVSWWVVLAGVLTFIASQVLRMPLAAGLNTLFARGILSIPNSQWVPVVNGVVAGLLAGICEESARWVGFKLLKKKAERFGSAFGLGVGHGGAESILLAVLGTAATLFTVLFYNPGAQIAKGVSTNEVQYMLFQIEQFWLSPWHAGLLPGVERVIAISTQIVLATLVWKSIADRSFVWFGLAILYHMVIDAVAVFLQGIGWNSWAIEGVLAIFLLLNIYLLYRFWKEESDLEEDMDELEDDEELASVVDESVQGDLSHEEDIERCEFCHEQVYIRQGGLSIVSGGGDDFFETLRQASKRKFVCPICSSTFCLDCGNKKGNDLETGSTHCPSCGHQVL